MLADPPTATRRLPHREQIRGGFKEYERAEVVKPSFVKQVEARLDQPRVRDTHVGAGRAADNERTRAPQSRTETTNAGGHTLLEAALLRLVSAILSEVSEEWESGKRYVTFNPK
jgi:hypothetical protein